MQLYISSELSDLTLCSVILSILSFSFQINLQTFLVCSLFANVVVSSLSFSFMYSFRLLTFILNLWFSSLTVLICFSASLYIVSMFLVLCSDCFSLFVRSAISLSLSLLLFTPSSITSLTNCSSFSISLIIPNVNRGCSFETSAS